MIMSLQIKLDFVATAQTPFCRRILDFNVTAVLLPVEFWLQGTRLQAMLILSLIHI